MINKDRLFEIQDDITDLRLQLQTMNSKKNKTKEDLETIENLNTEIDRLVKSIWQSEQKEM